MLELAINSFFAPLLPLHVSQKMFHDLFYTDVCFGFSMIFCYFGEGIVLACSVASYLVSLVFVYF